MNVAENRLCFPTDFITRDQFCSETIKTVGN